jgi:hypothetical protein
LIANQPNFIAVLLFCYDLHLGLSFMSADPHQSNATKVETMEKQDDISSDDDDNQTDVPRAHASHERFVKS